MSVIRFLEMTLVVRDKEQRLMMSLRASAGRQTFQIDVGITSRFIKSIMCRRRVLKLIRHICL